MRLQRFPEGATEAERREFGRNLLAALDALGVRPGDEFEVVAIPVAGGRTSEPTPAHQKARRDDPDTAKRAAVLAFPRQGNQRRRLLDAFMAAPDGLTAEEAALRTSINYVSASTRITELVRGGWLEDSGAVRPTSSGTDAAVLLATAAAREGVTSGSAA